jgi:hypothetical protein
MLDRLVQTNKTLSLTLASHAAIAPVTLNNGRTIFVADAHRDDGKRFVVRADEKLSAFVELEAAIRDGQRFAPSHG